VLWGEAEDKAPGMAAHAGQRPSRHPFLVGEEALSAALASGSPAEPLNAQVSLLLPTFNGAPVPSPQLLVPPRPGRQRKATLTAWRVHGLALPVADAARWLAACRTGGTMESPGALLGADVRYWSTAAKLVLELLARGRYVPSVEARDGDGGDGLRGVWLPVLSDPDDRRRLELLADTMPGLCRAVCGDGKEEAPVSPRRLLRDFVRESVDACVHRWLHEEVAGEPKPKSGLRPAGEAWLRSLSRPNTPIRSRPGHLQRLVEGIKAWLVELASGEDAAVRTCFRLEPPDTADHGRAPAEAPDDWQLGFLLQSVEDPSLLLPAEDLWTRSSRSRKAAGLRVDRPQERLLKDLGRAVRLMPALDRSLQLPKPAGCALSNTEAYDFLRVHAWLLEESGFGVLVPPWWRKGGAAGARLGVKAKLRSTAIPKMTGGGIGLDELIRYDWQLALGDETLTEDELRRLAELKAPLVKVRGQWVELQPEQLGAALRFFETGRAGNQMTLGEALRLANGLADDQIGLPVVSVEAEGELSTMLGRLSGEKRLRKLRAPADFRGVLRPYQEHGFSWLAFLRDLGLGGCLADDMGLGKTIQFLALMLRDLETDRHLSPTLLLCPTSVVGNWKREAERFAPSLRVAVHHGPDRLRGDRFTEEARSHHLVVSTYALALRDQDDLAQVEWQGVVLDEAQNIKNPGAKQTRAIRGLRAQYRFALTGTPVENRLGELWSIMQFLNPGYLGSQKDFQARFALPIERYGADEAAAQLRGLVQPFLLRRVKTDPKIIDDLPEKTEMQVCCTLTKEQATLYQAVVDDLLEEVDEAEGIERRGKVLGALSKLKQVCNHPAQFLGDGSPLDGRSGKLNRLRELVDEVLAEGHKALLFTQFAQMGELLQHDLRRQFGREVLFLHGGVTKKRRDELVARFQTATGPPLFVLSLKAGGVGLNLTEANHVFHYDRWWNPAVENQATDRAFRIGQKRNVNVHKFVCAGTLEERIEEMLEMKKALADSIIGAGEGWITELSTAELRDLFALRKEAVSDD